MRFPRATLTSAYPLRIYPNIWDILALFFVLAIILLLAWAAKQMVTPYQLGETLPISLDPADLPFYAVRTIVRMLIALCCSLLFTFIFGTWAAKSKRAEKLIIPIIDILQSVPILGFLSVTVAGLIGLFPGSLLGPECAAIFAIFTSQAWNMALGFYQTVRAVPSELREAAAMFHLSWWQRFWRIDVSFSLPGLLWNMMMSMSAGWFFVVASEAITVSHQTILLPGIGSYIAVAIQEKNLSAIGYAILTMFVVILMYDQILFRPLVAWAEKFKTEQLAAEKTAQSWVVNAFRRTRLLRYIGMQLAFFLDGIINIRWFGAGKVPSVSIPLPLKSAWVGNLFWYGLISAMVIGVLFVVGHFVYDYISVADIKQVFLLGLITAARVFIMIILCSLFWVPVGVWIGLKPKIAHIAQPIAQFLAAFPANLLYPFVVMLILYYQVNPTIWLTPLMILGAQWYIVFNVIAGASTLPKDLLQAADNLGVIGWLRWYRLILPGIFPYYITGAITAAGGAWNASIVAEVASWGNQTLTAVGLGSYISEYTKKGDFIHIGLGIGMMCTLVLIFNRLVWRPLYIYVENRFQLE